MFLFSLFLWPSPSVALVGAIMIPFAVRAGLSPLAAAMAMNLFGHGFALSYDVVIQALRPYRRQQREFLRPTILSQAWPVFWVMGGVTVLAAFLLNRKSMGTAKLSSSGNVVNKQDSGSQGNSRQLWALAAAVPLAFLAVLYACWPST